MTYEEEVLRKLNEFVKYHFDQMSPEDWLHWGYVQGMVHRLRQEGLKQK